MKDAFARSSARRATARARSSLSCKTSIGKQQV